MSPLILQHSSERREYIFSEQLIPYYKLQWVSSGHFREWKASAVGRSPPSPATQQPSHGHQGEGRYVLQSPCSDGAGAWSGLQPLWKKKPTLHSSRPLGFSLLLKNSCEITKLVYTVWRKRKWIKLNWKWCLSSADRIICVFLYGKNCAI